MIVTPTALWHLSLLPDGKTTCYTHDELTRYFEINSISFHLIFLRKVDSCWSLVSMRHIIHKFVNVYPYIAYSSEVAIHIIISWILGSGPRWYGKWHSHVIQEQGNNYSWVDLIAFLFEVFKYLFKKLFFRQIFLQIIYFPSCKIPENQESASLMVTNKVMSYTDYTMTPCIEKVFIATYICIWSTMYNHYANSHICCLWLEKDPIWFLGTKVNL